MGEAARENMCFVLEAANRSCQAKVMPNAGSAFKVWQNPSQKRSSSNTDQTYEGKGGEIGLNLNLLTEEIDQPNTKRMKPWMANREHSKEERSRKNNNVMNLEKQVSSLEAKISNVKAQIEEDKSYMNSMLSEQLQMKPRITTLENDRVVIQDQIEHNKAEVKRLMRKRLQMIKESANLEHAIHSNAAINVQRPTPNYYGILWAEPSDY
ncbi:hypothetical protein PIB30_085545 [Stylosanthes scabra]|uniref:Uncharacterized protein n=1 Tax=Stylosanthes scabra TaxID=79078 RepID=A0ABU6RTP3_9FABA|nr:hypothetical protein [Stylosanthes scabra]